MRIPEKLRECKPHVNLSATYWLEGAYGKLAPTVNSHPFKFIAVPLVITLGMLYGCSLYSGRQIYDYQFLLAPSFARYWKEIRGVDEVWPLNPDHFSAYKYFNYEYTALALILRKDTGNVVTLPTIEFAEDFNNHILNMTVGDSDIDFTDLCMKWHAGCSYTNKHTNAIRMLLKRGWAKNLTFPVMTLGEGNHLPVGGLLGGVDMNPKNGSVESAKVMLMIYHLNPLAHLEDYKVNWEIQFSDYCEQITAESPKYDVVCYNSMTKQKGMNELMVVVMLRLIVAIAMLIVVLTSSGIRWQVDENGQRLWKLDYWRSKMMLSCSALITVASGVLFAFGSILYTGFYFETVLVMMPFLVMGEFNV